MRKWHSTWLPLVMALAGTTGSAAAAPCQTARLSAYQSIGAAGCSVGGLTFSDFTVEAFPGPTAAQLAPAGIVVTPIAGGFSLSSENPLSANPGQLLGLRLLFDVGAATLTGATVTLGAQTTVSGDGVITALFDAGPAGVAIALVSDGFSDTPASFTSSSSSAYDAFLELGIDGGTAGSATLGPLLASLTFAPAAPIPEPNSAALWSAGLLAGLALRRARRSRIGAMPRARNVFDLTPRNRRRRASLPSLAVGALLCAAPLVHASSHREAPMMALDQKADITDVYAFRSYDGGATPRVTLILNVDPFLEPGNGPNWFPFDPGILYEIKIDNNNDAVEDIVFQIRFNTEQRLPNLFQAYAGAGSGVVAPFNSPGPVTPGTLVVPPRIVDFDSPGLGQRQSYTVTMVKGGVATPITNGTGLPMYAVPANVGPRTMDYNALFSQATYSTNLPNVKLFSGTVDDPFWLDLGGAFDTLNTHVSPVLSPAMDASSTNIAADTLSGYAVNAIAIEVPVSLLTRTGAVESATSTAATIGVWATTSRQRTLVRRSPLPAVGAGTFDQLQRMGNPLINELLIGTGSKDRYSMDQPKNDSQFAPFVLDPTLARVLNALTAGAVAIPPPPRNDLLPLVTYAAPIAAPGTPAGPVADLLRLNTGVAPTLPANASRLGLLGGDAAGYPNGRRLMDDVVDISLRVVAGVLVPGFNVAPNNRLGDGVNVNDVPYRTTFPYLANAPSGRDRRHIDPAEPGCTMGGGPACAP